MSNPDEKAGGEPAPPAHGWVTAQVPLDVLIQKLKEPKDVRVLVFSAGAVAAVCKSCNVQIQPADKEGLLWFVCPGCRRATFIVLANLPRDLRLAEQNGGVFEYEVFYPQELPPGFAPPG